MRAGRARRIAGILVAASVAASVLVPAAVSAIPDAGGSVGSDTEARLAPVIPAAWKDAGYELACECTTRRSAGRHLLSDDPHGCGCGTDVMVVSGGCCYQVNLPTQ